jgi:hypothetical protein
MQGQKTPLQTTDLVEAVATPGVKLISPTALGIWSM